MSDKQLPPVASAVNVTPQATDISVRLHAEVWSVAAMSDLSQGADVPQFIALFGSGPNDRLMNCNKGLAFAASFVASLWH